MKAKIVVLVNPNQDENCHAPTLGLAYIAAVLRKYLFEVIILDMINVGGEDKLLHEIDNIDPLLVGFYTLTFSFPVVQVLLSKVKQLSNAPLVLGGPHASFMSDQVLRTCSDIDYVCLFESEYTMLELALSLREGGRPQNVEGLALRTGKVNFIASRRTPPDLDNLPFPARDLLPMNSYTEQTKGGIMTSRGCNRDCAFCSSKAFFGRQLRHFSLIRIINEIKILNEKYNISHLNFFDDTFTLDRYKVMSICKRIQEMDLGITWGCQTRVDLVDERLLAAMRQAGCIQVFYGTESTDKDVLKKAFKDIDKQQMQNAIFWAKKNDIGVQISLLIGLPGDTKQRCSASLNEMLVSGPDSIIPVFATPFPGSLLWKEVRALNYRIIERDFGKYDYMHPIYETNSFRKEEMIECFLEARMVS